MLGGDPKHDPPRKSFGEIVSESFAPVGERYNDFLRKWIMPDPIDLLKRMLQIEEEAKQENLETGDLLHKGFKAEMEKLPKALNEKTFPKTAFLQAASRTTLLLFSMARPAQLLILRLTRDRCRNQICFHKAVRLLSGR